MNIIIIILFGVCFVLFILVWYMNWWWDKWSNETLDGWQKAIDLNDELLKDNKDMLEMHTKAYHFILDKNLLTEFDKWEYKE